MLASKYAVNMGQACCNSNWDSVSFRDSDSESSGSGPVDVSVYGCGSVAGDSDWDSDLSDSDPARSSRNSASGGKSSSSARSKRPPAELGWDEEAAEPDVPTEPLGPRDRAGKVSQGLAATSMALTQDVPMATNPTVANNPGTPTEQSSTTKKVTWQFKPAQRSVCTGSKKEREKEVMSSPMARFRERGPSSSSSSSTSSSPSS